MKVTAWNMRGITASTPYIRKLLHDTDICILSEHHLFECELHKLRKVNDNFMVYAKASDVLSNYNLYSGRGCGGIAILWHQSLTNVISKCTHLGDDRICVIKINVEHCLPVYIVGVYLPQRDCKISDFDEYLYHLEHVVSMCHRDGSVIIMGDFNCHFGPAHGPRAWGTTTPNAGKLYSVSCRQELSIVDLNDKCTGPNYTFNVSKVGMSYIDHCMVSNYIMDKIVSCEVIDDDVMNTSDHLALKIKVDMSMPHVTQHKSTPKVMWGKVSPDEIVKLYTKQLEGQ